MRTRVSFSFEQVNRTRVQNDERLVYADGAGVYQGRLGDVQLWPVGPVERRHHFGQEAVECGELSRPHPHGVRLEQESDSALSEKPHDFSHRFIEPGYCAQCLQRSAIGGVLPTYRRDFGQDDSRASARAAVR